MNKKQAFVLSVVLLASIFVLGLASVSFALWYDITISTVAITTIAGVVLAALAVMWVIRKAIKTTNKSAFIGPLIGAGAGLLYARNAFALEWYENVALPTTAIEAIAAVVLAALAIMWVIRKAIKTTNKS